MTRIRKGQLRNSDYLTQASPASITPDCTQYGVYDVTALANTLAINAPTNVLDGDVLTFRIYSAAAQNLAWNIVFNGGAFSLPNSSIAGSQIVVSFIYSLARTRWEYQGGSGVGLPANTSNTGLSILGKTILPIVNGDFSLGTGTQVGNGWIGDITYGWYANGAGTRTASFDTGRLKLQTSSSAAFSEVSFGNGYYLSDLTYALAVEPLTTYTIDYDMETLYASGDSNDGAFLTALVCDSAGGNTTGNPGTKIKTTTTSTHRTITFTTNAVQTRLNVQARIYGHTGTGTLQMSAWFDNIVISCTSKGIAKQLIPQTSILNTDRFLFTRKDESLGVVSKQDLKDGLGINPIVVTVGNGVKYDFNIANYSSGVNAWDAVIAAQASLPSEGGVVEIQNGTYTVGTSARLLPKNKVTIRARTWKGVTFTGARASDWIIHNPSVNGSLPILDFNIEGITFDLNNVSAACGVRLYDAVDCHIRRCKFLNGASGGWFSVFGTNSNSNSILGVDNSVENCIFDTHAGTLEMELSFNQVNYQSIKNVYKNKSGGSTAPCLGLYQKMSHTVIDSPRFYNNAGFCIYYSNSCTNTTIINPYAENSGTLIQGSNVSDNLNNGPLGGYFQSYGLTVTNLIAKGGANSTASPVIQLGAIDGFNVEITYADNYQIGVHFTRGNNGNILPAINGNVYLGTLKNMNAAGASADLSPGVLFTKSNPNANINIYGGEIFDDRGTPLSIQPVFFEWSDLTTTATATVSGGAVTSIAVDDPTNVGYETVPNITFTGGGGTGAAAHAVMDVASNGGKILSIVVDSGGTGYSSAPTVNIQNTTANNTYGGIRFFNSRLVPYSGRSSVKKHASVTLNASTVEFMSIRNKVVGTLSAYYKEYSDGTGGGGGLSDGDYGDVTVSGSGTIMKIDKGAFQRALFEYPNPPMKIISKYEVLESNFYANGSVALDTTDEEEGTGRFTMTLSTAGATGIRHTLASPLNINYTEFTIEVESSAWANVSYYEILLGNDGSFVNAYTIQVNQKVASLPNHNGESFKFQFSLPDLSVFAGTPNPFSITHILVRGQASSGTPTISGDNFRYTPTTQKPCFINTFDDGLASQYDEIIYGEKYDIYSTVFVYPELIGSPGQLTWPQCFNLQKRGHTIAFHGQTDMTTLTATQIRDYMVQQIEYFSAHSIERPFVLALPLGAFNDATVTTLKEFVSILMTVDWQYNHREYFGQGIMNRFSPDSGVALSTMRAWRSNLTNFNAGMLCTAWHGIVASAPTGVQVLQSDYRTFIDEIGAEIQAGKWQTKSLQEWCTDPIVPNSPSTLNPLTMASRFLDSWGGYSNFFY